MYDTLLVPTDGSEHARRAAEHARYLADAFDASVHVIAVVDVERATGRFDAVDAAAASTDRLEADAEAAIEAATDALDGARPIRTELLRGAPSEVILDYADEVGADLLAMGTHGRSGVDRYVAGSVTERVVRESPVPVLAVGAGEQSRVDDGYDEVLLPTDGSDAAAAAVDHGVAVARAVGARVHAVGVVDADAVVSRPEFDPPPEVVAELQARAERAVDEVTERARAAGLNAVSDVREGVPAEELLAYAESAGADLIAMGTAGATGTNRFLLGSTTERVVRNAPVPVLAVNTRDGADGDEG